MNILIYIGSIFIFIWGAAHLFPTNSVVNGFEPVTIQNKRIIMMEWLAEGVSLCFVGILVFLVSYLFPKNSTGIFVVFASAIFLFILAIITFFTGSRTNILPMKLCPFIKLTAAILFIIGSLY